ncbi:MAG TPA: sensor histidine kinase, partial [Chloroflexota bacterium]|nr:sensor histidine kinase [Chloroflexota bacterium]
DLQFLQDIGDRAGLVLENARLFEQLRASQERSEKLSRHLVQLQERERRAIALELHDEVGPSLIAARLLITAARRLPARLRDERLDEASRALDQSVGQLRGLSLDLRPPMLERFGLTLALEGYLERYQSRTRMTVKFDTSGLDSRPPADVEIAAYRIVQEALTNVARHAGVAEAEVRLWCKDGRLQVEVCDGGAGFDPAAPRHQPSTGLSGLQERAELLGGHILIESAPGQGTRVAASLPLRIQNEE